MASNNSSYFYYLTPRKSPSASRNLDYGLQPSIDMPEIEDDMRKILFHNNALESSVDFRDRRIFVEGRNILAR